MKLFIGVQAFLIGGLSALFCLKDSDVEILGYPISPMIFGYLIAILMNLLISYGALLEPISQVFRTGSPKALSYLIFLRLFRMLVFEFPLTTFGFILVAAPVITIKRKVNDHALFWSISVFLIWLTVTTVIIWLAISLR